MSTRTSRRDLAALPAAYRALHDELEAVLGPERLMCDPLRTLAFGTDASFYRLVPKVVVRVRSSAEVAAVLGAAARRSLPVTFRAAGTSLSGQAVSDSVLVVIAGGFRGARVSEDASRIALEPGVIGAEANAMLAPAGRKLGPDPASIGACMIGGIAANNASGMCCGTSENSYQTVESMKLVLWDGTLVDTADPESRRALAASHPELLAGLAAVRDEIAADPALRDRIVSKYRIKNTTGYSLNAFVDFSDPIDILLHLMIGSEGTLGFMAEITYRTVPEHAHKASALALFATIGDAARATMLLRGGPVAAAELMDRASLRSVETKPGMPPELVSLAPAAAALLVEVRAPDATGLAANVEAALRRLEPVPALFPVAFTDRPAEFQRLWDVRRGLFPAVGAARRVGTTVVIEDVAFPIEHLADATLDLQRLMHAHGYDEGIIFGHALDGNLHFVFTQDFSTEAEVARYARFMDAVCDLVVRRYDGSLKGEHGTGRNVAPFVALEWGEKAYALMRRVKSLLDPRGLLNPGVILDDRPTAHLENLKPLPPAHEIIDRCTECGFCEQRCPSRELTLTPRQRIAVRREIARLEATGADPQRRERLEADYAYQGEATCATDGLCATVCPVGIDTGLHTKWLRARRADGDGAAWAAENFATAMAGARAALRAGAVAEAVLGPRVLGGVSRALHRATRRRLPVWSGAMPRGVAPRFEGTAIGSDLAVVYFPSCVARTMGPPRGDDESTAVYAATLSLLAKARCDVIFPRELPELCCGLSFDSKGYPQEGERKRRELEAALLSASGGGVAPILFDTSPCAYRMRDSVDPRLRIYEPVEFIQRFLLPRLSVTRVPGPVAVHVPCSAVKMGLSARFRDLAAACAERVVIPAEVGCCGFAGDRGFSHPELTASALARLAPAVAGCEVGYSTSRTCEIGLTRHGGIRYRSITALVDRCASALPESPPPAAGH